MFDPEKYAKNIRAQNAELRKKIDERLVVAYNEAESLAQKIKENDKEVKAVYLFGSVARKNAFRLDFDIDLALEGGDVYKAMDIVDESDFKVDLVSLALMSPERRELLLLNAIRLA